MNSTVNFLLESGISLALLATIYVLFLRKETFFKLNRAFLLGSILFSAILPLLRFRVFEPKSIMLSEVTVTPNTNLVETITIYSKDLSGTIEHVVLSTDLLIIAYFLGVFVLLAQFVFRVGQIVVLIRKNEVRKNEHFKLVVLDKEVSPFSFLNYVFIGKNFQNQEGYERMIMHEVEHINQGHTFDIILLEVLTIFQWFNPFMWMLRRAMRENHEFLADQAVLTSGISRGNYKKLLLSQFVGEQIVLANNFNYSLIKKRIKMMSKMKSSKLALSKLLFGFVVVISLIIVFACEQKDDIEANELASTSETIIKLKIIDDKLQLDADSVQMAALKKIFASNSGFNFETDSLGNIFLVKENFQMPKFLDDGEPLYFIVEEMPEFPGGDSARAYWLQQNIKYPIIAQENGIQGKVYVSFVIAKDGSVTNAKIEKGVDPSLDQEALRVVNQMPKWKPGVQRGQAVNVSYTVPINFALQ